MIPDRRRLSRWVEHQTIIRNWDLRRAGDRGKDQCCVGLGWGELLDKDKGTSSQHDHLVNRTGDLPARHVAVTLINRINPADTDNVRG